MGTVTAEPSPLYPLQKGNKNMTMYEILWYFLIYAFLGWCVEVIYQATKRGRVVNRGFLCGPLCPVYGFGVLAVLVLIERVLPALTGVPGSELASGRKPGDIVIIFVCGVVLATLIELFAGWILNVAFHARWWDYSDEPFNFHGYICLRFSLLWGAAIVFVVRVVHPVIKDAVACIPPRPAGWVLLAIFYLILLVDFIVTVAIVIGLNKHLAELDQIQQNMKIVSDHLSERIGTSSIRTQQTIDASRVQITLAGYEAKDEFEKRQKELSARAEEVKSRIRQHPVFGSGRILSAFPDMRHGKYTVVLADLQDQDPEEQRG